MYFQRKGQFFLLVILLFILTSCSSSGGSHGESNARDQSNGNKDEIVIGQINWPENIAVTNMWKAILEDEGYDVELTLIEMGPQMVALAEGDIDVAPEVWLPVQDRSYYEEYKDDVNFAEEPWYDNGRVGLVVTEYIDSIDSIEDLNENKDMFDSEITGFEPGAGTMEVTSDVIDEYHLDYNLVESSEAVMISAIKDAIEKKEPIVAPLWKPHYIFADVDLKFLDDPKNTYGDTEKIYLATRKDFDSDYEEVYQWMENWILTDDQLSDLMLYVNEDENDPMKGARKWIEENEDIIETWME